MARTVSYINTTPKAQQAESRSSSASSATRSYGSSGASSLTMKEVLERLLPVIGENYADAIAELRDASYLFNPSFANDAEGWAIPSEDAADGKVTLLVSDNKVRLNLRDGGSVSQANSLIRQPGTHFVYTFTEEEGEEEGGTSAAEAEAAAVSETLVTKLVEWEEIEAPEQTVGKEEVKDILYLYLSFTCSASGTLQAGFPLSDQTSEESLKTVSQSVEASGTVQTIRTQGTWDGTGDFVISVPSGDVEIVSLLLTDKPLEDYREQTDSCLKQVNENITKAYEAIVQILQRLVQIQAEINVLYNNDAILDGLVNDLEERVEELSQVVESHGTRLDAVEKKADTAYEWAAENWYEIEYTLKPDISSLNTALTNAVSSITALQTSLATVTTSLTSLEERVKKLEGS